MAYGSDKNMMRSLHTLAIFVAIYVTVLLVRTEGLIEVKFFGMDGGSFPKWGVWAVHAWAFLFFRLRFENELSTSTPGITPSGFLCAASPFPGA